MGISGSDGYCPPQYDLLPFAITMWQWWNYACQYLVMVCYMILYEVNMVSGGFQKLQPFNIAYYMRISRWDDFWAHTHTAVAICNKYVALVKLCMKKPCTGVENYPLRGYHGFRWNLNASAFQKGALHGYLRLRWLLPTSIWPVTICNNYVAVDKFYMPIPCNGVLYDPLRTLHGFRWNYKAAAFQCLALYRYLTLIWLLRT